MNEVAPDGRLAPQEEGSGSMTVMASGSTSYGRIADRYERVRGGDTRAEELADGLRPWIPDGLVCDVGAGTGVVTDRLRRPGVEFVGCDISPEMIARAADRFPGRVHVGDATKLPIRNDSLDAVIYVWVLHHVAHLVGALAEARRVLRPNGRVISVSGISLPANDDMGPIFERLNDQLRPDRLAQSSAVATAGCDVGLVIVHEGVVRTTATTSPNALADSITQRLFAPLWDLPNDVWEGTVEPVIAALRSLPEPGRPRRRVFDHPLVVLANPGG